MLQDTSILWFILICYRILLFLAHISVTGYSSLGSCLYVTGYSRFRSIFLCYSILLFFCSYLYVTGFFHFWFMFLLQDTSVFGSYFYVTGYFCFWFIFLCYWILQFFVHISVTGYFCFWFIFLCYRILLFWFIFLCYRILLFLVHISMLQDTSVLAHISMLQDYSIFGSYFYVTGYFCFWFIFLCYMIILSSVYISMWQDINVFGSHFRVTEYSYFRFIFLLHDILKQLIIIYPCRKPPARTEDGVSLLLRGNNFTWTYHGHFYPVNLQTTHVDIKWPWDRFVTRWSVCLSISFVNHNSLSFCAINVRYIWFSHIMDGRILNTVLSSVILQAFRFGFRK
jgi:hypothetical protein